MTRDQLLAEFRELVDDKAGPPYAWTDLRAFAWMSEGQDEFCKETGFFRDSQSYIITTAAGVQDYPLDPRIIEVEEVWDGLRRLNKFNQGQRPRVMTPEENPNQLPWNWQTDKSTGVLTLFEPPLAGLILNLHVWRKSKRSFVTRDLPLEIFEDFHLAVVEYAAAKAFGDHDRERQDPVKAKDHMANFYAYCARGRKAYVRIMGAPMKVAPNTHYLV